MLRLSKGRTYTAPVVMRALDIIELLFHHPSPLKLDEISTRTRVARSSTYRILGTLVQRGYISRSLDGYYSYCRSKAQKDIGPRNNKLSMMVPVAQTMEESIWVERTIETLLALLQESRRNNPVPLPLGSDAWQTVKQRRA